MGNLIQGADGVRVLKYVLKLAIFHSFARAHQVGDFQRFCWCEASSQPFDACKRARAGGGERHVRGRAQ